MRGTRAGALFQSHIDRRDQSVLAHDERAPHAVDHFPYIARPPVVQHAVEALPGKACDFVSAFVVELIEKKAREDFNVAVAVSQRREKQPQNIEAVVQVFAETGHRPPPVPDRRGSRR